MRELNSYGVERRNSIILGINWEWNYYDSITYYTRRSLYIFGVEKNRNSGWKRNCISLMILVVITSYVIWNRKAVYLIDVEAGMKINSKRMGKFV